MDEKVSNFINDIKDDSFAVLRGEFVTFVDGLKDQADDFSKLQRVKLEKYLLQLANREITKQQFDDAMSDLKTVLDMEITLGKVKTKASAQRMRDGMVRLVINGLIKAIPG